MVKKKITLPPKIELRSSSHPARSLVNPMTEIRCLPFY
jgi:hypothetical protein